MSVMQIGTQGEEEVQRKITVARERWRDRLAVRNRMALTRRIGDLATKWKLKDQEQDRRWRNGCDISTQTLCGFLPFRERVLFIGTRFSNFYTSPPCSDLPYVHLQQQLNYQQLI
jgi:hypothetical protein